MKLSISDTIISPFYLPRNFYRGPSRVVEPHRSPRVWDLHALASFALLVVGVGGFAVSALAAFPV